MNEHTGPQGSPASQTPEHAPTHETTPIPPTPETSGTHEPGPAPSAPASQPVGAEGTSGPSKSSGKFLAGIAIGALVGALAGGATGAVIAGSDTQVVTQTGGGEITIANPEATTPVSAIAQKATPSTVTIDAHSEAGSGTGSGVVYSSDGYIVTNAHVVSMEGVQQQDVTLRVMLSDGRILPGTVVGVDPYSDIAVLKVDAEGLTPMTVADTDLQVGDAAVAIGAPFELSNTVTSGVVSTLNRGISVGSALIPESPQPDDPSEESPFEFRFDGPSESAPVGGQVTLPVIQTDASINPGNSGGPLLNSSGELVGINVAIASAGQNEEAAGSVGLGFAIPVELASRVADSIIDGDTPSHGLLGATVLDSRMQQESSQRGGLVRDVENGSAAAKAGIKSGDIITAVNDTPTPDGTTVSAMIRYFEGGSDVTVDVTRDGETHTFDVTLGTL